MGPLHPHPPSWNNDPLVTVQSGEVTAPSPSGRRCANSLVTSPRPAANEGPDLVRGRPVAATARCQAAGRNHAETHPQGVAPRNVRVDQRGAICRFVHAGNGCAGAVLLPITLKPPRPSFDGTLATTAPSTLIWVRSGDTVILTP